MKKIVFTILFLSLQFSLNAQEVLSSFFFQDLYSNRVMRPQFMNIAKHRDSKYIYLLESNSNQQLSSRIIKKVGNNESIVYTDAELIRQIVPLQNRSIMAKQSANGRACSLAIHFFNNDTVISTPLNLQASNMIFDIRGLCALEGNIGALLLKVTSNSPNLGDVVYLFNSITGAYLNHFSLNTTSLNSTFKIEAEFNTANLKVYHINRTEIYVDRLSSNGVLLNRNLILTHPLNRFFDYFSTTLFETPTPNTFYCIFNGNTPRNEATSYIANGAIRWTNTGSLLWAGDFVNRSQDVFLRSDSVVVARRMRYHYIKRISNANQLVWQSLIDSTSLLNDMDAVSNIPLAASVMNDSTLLLAGVKTFNTHPFTNPAIPYLIEIRNAGQAWRAGMLVNTREIEKPISYTLYPNPATKRVKIKLNAQALRNPVEAAIYSITGSKVGTYPLLGNETELDISSLSSGMYLLKIPNAETQKLIVE